MVGRPLFTRLGRGLVPTPTGQQHLADVTGSLADPSRATERASSFGAHHIVYPSQNAELSRVAKFLVWVEQEVGRDAAGR
jgi:hypothetical protein